MIGPHYWSTGITLRPVMENPVGWSVSLDYLDDGFVDHRSTEGTMRLRQPASPEELPEAIAILKGDAEAFGIKWQDPTVYVAGDGEWKSITYPPGWRDIAREQAKRLGWRQAYRSVS